jgi:hypothetical protein
MQTNYQKDLAICVSRLKEVFKEAKIDKLEGVELKPKENLDFNTPTEYDISTNTIYIDNKRMAEVDDTAHAMMYGVLEAVTTDKETKNIGVSFDGKMEALNKGINHMVANLLIPSTDENDTLFTSYIMANVLTHIAGADTVLDAYFNSNGKKMYDALLNKLGNDEIFLDTMLEFTDIEAKSLSERHYPSLLSYTQESIARTYFKNNDLSLEEAIKFKETVFTTPELAPEGEQNRLYSCVNCEGYLTEQINKIKGKNNSTRKKAEGKELLDMFEEPTFASTNGDIKNDSSRRK